jgi:hypothetical protein
LSSPITRAEKRPSPTPLFAPDVPDVAPAAERLGGAESDGGLEVEPAADKVNDLQQEEGARPERSAARRRTSARDLGGAVARQWTSARDLGGAATDLGAAVGRCRRMGCAVGKRIEKIRERTVVGPQRTRVARTRRRSRDVSSSGCIESFSIRYPINLTSVLVEGNISISSVFPQQKNIHLT